MLAPNTLHTGTSIGAILVDSGKLTLDPPAHLAFAEGTRIAISMRLQLGFQSRHTVRPGRQYDYPYLPKAMRVSTELVAAFSPSAPR
jgi:hypothetical protein